MTSTAKENFYAMVDARIQQEVGTNMSAMASEIAAAAKSANDLSGTITNLVTRIKALEDTAALRGDAIADLTETPATLTLSLGSITLLGSDQLVLKKKVNQILKGLRLKTIKT